MKTKTSGPNEITSRAVQAAQEYNSIASLGLGAWIPISGRLINGYFVPSGDKIRHCCRRYIKGKDAQDAKISYALIPHLSGAYHIACKHGVTVRELKAALRVVQVMEALA